MAAVIRALSAASRPLLEEPDPALFAAPLLSQRGAAGRRGPARCPPHRRQMADRDEPGIGRGERHRQCRRRMGRHGGASLRAVASWPDADAPLDRRSSLARGL